MPVVGSGYFELSCKFRASINAARRRGIGLEVRARLFAIEDIIGRQMDNRNAKLRGRRSNNACAVAVYCEGKVRFGFRPVNRSIRSWIDYDVWRKREEGLLDQVGANNIDVWAPGAADHHIRAIGRRFTQ